VFMTESRDVTPKTTEQNLIVRTGKPEAKVTDNKRLRSKYCTVEANYREPRNIARPLCDSRSSYLLAVNIGYVMLGYCRARDCTGGGLVPFVNSTDYTGYFCILPCRENMSDQPAICVLK